MLVLQAAKFADPQILAVLRKLGVASLFIFARLQTFGRRLVCRRHRAMIGNGFFGVRTGIFTLCEGGSSYVEGTNYHDCAKVPATSDR